MTQPQAVASHVDCDCVRCSGFARGNGAAVRHGAYAVVRLTPRAEELAAELRRLVPLATPIDGPAIDALALVLAQLERAMLVLSTVQTREVAALTSGGLDRDDRDDLRRLAADARGWANTARRYFDMLGLSPASRLRLGLDLVRVEDGIAQLIAEGREVRERAERRLGGGGS